MSVKKTLEEELEEEKELVDAADDDSEFDGDIENLSADDYAFILDRNGDLKTFLLPTGISMNEEVPDRIIEILKAFGIDNLTDMQPHTLH